MTVYSENEYYEDIRCIKFVKKILDYKLLYKITLKFIINQK